MKYLKIENAGSLDRRAIRYWGFSTKREAKDGEPQKVGHKGTGTNLAPLAAYRLGLDIHITSTDSLGTFMISYDSEEIRIGDFMDRELFLCTLNVDSKDGTPTSEREKLSLLEGSFKDWDKPIGSDIMASFKSLREPLLNARDEGSCKLSWVDEIAIEKPGRTAVYLRCTPEIEAMLVDLASRYFKFRKKQTALVRYPDVGAVYEKSDQDNTRLFVQGVLVGCYGQNGLGSVYDYSVEDPERKLVSEERQIKNYWEYVNAVAKLFGRIPVSSIIENILYAVEAGDAAFEESVLGRMREYASLARKAWRNAVRQVYGPKIAVSSGNLQLDNDCEQIFRYKVIRPRSDDVRTFLRGLGVAKVQEIVPNGATLLYEQIPWEMLDTESRLNFEQAFEIFARFYSDRAEYPIAFFHPLNKQMRSFVAVAGLGNAHLNEVWIATTDRTSLPSVASILTSLIHESRHCASGAGDYDRRFMNVADKDAVEPLLRLMGVAEHEDGTPVRCEVPIGDIQPRFAPMREGPLLSDDDT